MNCPSCGAELEVDSRFAYLVVCAHCESTVVRDADALRIAGKMAVLKPPSGVLYTGAVGRLGDRDFRVLGRVRYGYPQGLWDEWFLGFEDGDTVWISEDEDDLTVESYVRLDDPPFDHGTLDPGERIKLGDKGFTVTEKDVATCEGGEGQLPFMIVPGEKVPFLDITGDDSFGTIEFDDDGVKVFVGKRISPEKIQLEYTREEMGIGGDWMAAGRTGAGSDRERVIMGQGAALSVKCTSCGAPQEVPDQGAATHECSYCGDEIDLLARQVDCPNCQAVIAVKSKDVARCVVCPKCRNQLDISSDSPSILASLANRKRPTLPLKLGASGTLRGREVEVAGHIRMVERSMWGTYVSDEFFLRTRAGKPLWLILENGHWTMGREVTGQPKGMNHPRHAYQRSYFTFGEGEYRVYEVGEAPMQIEYVEGELPWVASVGDKFEYMDAIAPPKMLSAEWTASELEWFEAEYVPVEEVAEAFKVPENRFPTPDGVGPCQPYEESAFRSEGTVIMGFFALMALFFFMTSLTSGDIVSTLSVPLSEIDGGDYLTEPFEIIQAPGIIQVSAQCGVDNQWVYAQMALIDDQDRALVEFDEEMSYYHGYEGGESWSEGSRSDYALFRLTQPGHYRLLVTGQGGHGNRGVGMPGNASPLVIEIYEAIELSRWYGFFFMLFGVISLWMGSAKARFEVQRWAPVTDDDD